MKPTPSTPSPPEGSQPQALRATGKIVQPDVLFSSLHLKLAERLNAEENLKPFLETTQRLTIPPEIATEITKRITAWRHTRDASHLAYILRRYPMSIATPALFKQIFHLSDLVRMVDEEDMADGGCPAVPLHQTKLLPGGTKQAARRALHQLLEAWIGGVLPGYNLEPKQYPKKKGRCPGMTLVERMRFLDEFNELFINLQEIETKTVVGLSREPGESREKHLARIVSVVEQLHETSWFYFDQKSVAWPWKKLPLPKGVAVKIAQQALSGKRVSPNTLLYGMFAQYLKNDYRRCKLVSRMIERAEEDFPDSHIRRTPL